MKQEIEAECDLCTEDSSTPLKSLFQKSYFALLPLQHLAVLLIHCWSLKVHTQNLKMHTIWDLLLSPSYLGNLYLYCKCFISWSRWQILKSKAHMYSKTIKCQQIFCNLEIKRSYKKTENINSSLMSSASEPATASAVVFALHWIIALCLSFCVYIWLTS